MRQGNKKKFIIIGIIAILVLCLIIGIVFAFTGANSNKNLFFKYAGQMFDSENGLPDSKLEQYNEKKNNTVFENYGKYNVTIDSENLDENTLDTVNNMNISFIGNVDNPNNSIEELIKINYTDDVNFAINVKKVEDSFGVKLNKIAKQYLVVENDGLEDLLEKVGIEDSMITSLLDVNGANTVNFKFSEEEKASLKDVYLKKIQDSLDDDNFTKKTNADSEGYSLEISNQKIKEILISLLETLKTDENMLNKIQEMIGQKIDEDDIDLLIENLNSQEVEDGKITITVYQSNGQLKKVSLQVNDSVKIEISKSSSEDTLEYNVEIISSVNEQNILLNLVAKYEGLQKLENVNESYKLSLTTGEENSTGYTYNIENEIKFIDSVEITKFTKSDSLVLNNLSQERLKTVFEQIGKKIEEVNAEQMEEIGVKGNNPLLYFIPGSYTYINEQSILSDVTNNMQDALEESEKETVSLAISYVTISKLDSNNQELTEDDIKKAIKELNNDNLELVELKDNEYTFQFKSTGNKYKVDKDNKVEKVE